MCVLEEKSSSLKQTVATVVAVCTDAAGVNNSQDDAFCFSMTSPLDMHLLSYILEEINL